MENCLHTPDLPKLREEAYAVLYVQPPGSHHDNHTLILKIDTGVMWNTLPQRTLKQMYGKRAYAKEVLTTLDHGKLTAYNGQKLEEEGNIPIWFGHKYSVWDQMTLYIVDVDGPVVVSLPTYERLYLMTMHVDNTHISTSKNGKPKVLTAQMRNISGLK